MWVHCLTECVLVGSVAVGLIVVDVVVGWLLDFSSARVERRILPG